MPGAVNLGHFATPEPFLLLAAAGTLLAAARHADGRAPAWAVGLALGLAASTKYTAAALAVPCLLAVLLRRARAPSGRRARHRRAGRARAARGGRPALRRRLRARRRPAPRRRAAARSRARRGLRGPDRRAAGDRRARRFWPWPEWPPPGWRAARALARAEIAIVAATALLAFVLFTPWALVEPRAFLSDLAFNDQTRYEYKGLVGAKSSYAAYLDLAEDALTLPMFIAAVTGTDRGRRASRAARPQVGGPLRRRDGTLSPRRRLRPPGPALPGPRLPRRGGAGRARRALDAVPARAADGGRARPRPRGGGVGARGAAVLRGLARAGHALAGGQRPPGGDRRPHRQQPRLRARRPGRARAARRAHALPRPARPRTASRPRP